MNCASAAAAEQGQMGMTLLVDVVPAQHLNVCCQKGRQISCDVVSLELDNGSHLLVPQQV